MVKITRRIKNNFLFVKNEKKERNIFMTFSSHTRSSWTHQTCQVDKKEALGSGGRCLSDKICDKKLTVCVVPFDKNMTCSVLAPSTTFYTSQKLPLLILYLYVWKDDSIRYQFNVGINFIKLFRYRHLESLCLKYLSF